MLRPSAQSLLGLGAIELAPDGCRTRIADGVGRAAAGFRFSPADAELLAAGGTRRVVRTQPRRLSNAHASKLAGDFDRLPTGQGWSAWQQFLSTLRGGIRPIHHRR